MSSRTLRTCRRCHEQRPTATFEHGGHRGPVPKLTKHCGHCKWPKGLKNKFEDASSPDRDIRDDLAVKAAFLQKTKDFVDAKIATGQLDEGLDREELLDLIKWVKLPYRYRPFGSPRCSPYGYPEMTPSSWIPSPEPVHEPSLEFERVLAAFVSRGSQAPGTGARSRIEEARAYSRMNPGQALNHSIVNPGGRGITELNHLAQSIDVENMAIEGDNVSSMTSAAVEVGLALQQILDAVKELHNDSHALEKLLQEHPRSRWIVIGIINDANIDVSNYIVGGGSYRGVEEGTLRGNAHIPPYLRQWADPNPVGLVGSIVDAEQPFGQ